MGAPEQAGCLCTRSPTFCQPGSGRFVHQRHAGLSATPYNSGGIRREQGIGKAGNRRLRTVMVELAWLWQRYQPDCAHVRWFRERTGATGARLRKVMVVALARKLLIALWRFVTQGVMPEGAAMKLAS
jgi:transposase